LDEVAEHRFGNFEVGDDAVLDRSDSSNAGRSSTEHRLRVVPDRQDAISAAVPIIGDCNDAGFRTDEALALHVDQGICSSQVDSEIVGEKAGD
jgi:hypothetical protein